MLFGFKSLVSRMSRQGMHSEDRCKVNQIIIFFKSGYTTKLITFMGHQEPYTMMLHQMNLSNCQKPPYQDWKYVEVSHEIQPRCNLALEESKLGEESALHNHVDHSDTETSTIEFSGEGNADYQNSPPAAHRYYNFSLRGTPHYLSHLSCNISSRQIRAASYKTDHALKCSLPRQMFNFTSNLESVPYAISMSSWNQINPGSEFALDSVIRFCYQSNSLQDLAF